MLQSKRFDLQAVELSKDRRGAHATRLSFRKFLKTRKLNLSRQNVCFSLFHSPVPILFGSSKLQRIHFLYELLITIQKQTQRNGSSSSCCNFGNTTAIHASISTTRSRTPIRTDHLSEQEHPRGKNQSRRSRDDA